MNTQPIYDSAGRSIAPPQTVLPIRPSGAWDFNVSVTPRAQQEGTLYGSLDVPQSTRLAIHRGDSGSDRGWGLSGTLASVCAWCPDAAEQTADARAHGYEVTHSLCEACKRRMDAEMDAIETAR